MAKSKLNPKSEDAMSSRVMHEVVLQGIDFELSDEIWDAIDDAFGNYWNIEVGFGGYPDLNSAVVSIDNWLKDKCIIFSENRIEKIVNVMFDWIEQVPGAILDDDIIAIPHSYENFEKERQKSKSLELNGTTSSKDGFEIVHNPKDVFNDSMTDFVYISDKLKEFYPGTYRRLTNLFDKLEIEWGEVKGTKDIWIRDYMPIPLADGTYAVYKYDPDYLKDSGTEFLTDSYSIFHGYIPEDKWIDLGIKMDGGNVVQCGTDYIFVEKIYRENCYQRFDYKLDDKLKDKLNCYNIIMIPWKTRLEKDIYGHADGYVRWTGDWNILMSNIRDTYVTTDEEEIKKILRDYANQYGNCDVDWYIKTWLESYPEQYIHYADMMKYCLEDRFRYKVTEMLFDVPHPNNDFNWAYINYLQVGHKIIVPTFGIPEDKQALKYIKDANPDCSVHTFRMRDIVSQGGGLHCITWNIKK